MGSGTPRTLPLRSEDDVVRLRAEVRVATAALGFSLVEQTKLVTAASELGRNTLVHGGGGEATIELLVNGARQGLRLTFEDEGPGIPDVERALTDGFTTGDGLGLGLGGSRRLVGGDMRIESTPGQGTRITVTRWR